MRLLWPVFIAYHLFLARSEDINVEKHASSLKESLSSSSGAESQNTTPEISPAEQVNRKAADKYIIMANAFLKRGSTDGALKELKKAINRAPNYADPYFIRGSIYVQMNDYLSALSDFISALDLAGGAHDSAFEYALEICNYLHGIEEYAAIVPALGVLHSYDVFDESLGRLYADTLLQTGDSLGALAVLEKYPLDVSTRDSAMLMASLYETAGRYCAVK